MLLCVCQQPLPRLRALCTPHRDAGDARRLLGAPWLAQLTRLKVVHGSSADVLLTALPAGLRLPSLRVFALAPAGTKAARPALHLAGARCLAACELPALQGLSLRHVDAGPLAELFVAPWAQGMEWLHLTSCMGSCTVSQAQTWTAPFTRLTRLLFDAPPLDRAAGGTSAADAAAHADAGASLLTPILSAPWAAGLQTLLLGGGGGTARALAAAPLPSLCTLQLRSTVGPDDITRLSAAPWLRHLQTFDLCHWDPKKPEGNRALAELRMPRLECLQVVHYKWGEAGRISEGLRVLATVPWLAQLQCLIVKGGSHIPPQLRAACQQEVLRKLQGGPIDALKQRGVEVVLRFPD